MKKTILLTALLCLGVKSWALPDCNFRAEQTAFHYNYHMKLPYGKDVGYWDCRDVLDDLVTYEEKGLCEVDWNQLKAAFEEVDNGRNYCNKNPYNNGPTEFDKRFQKIQ